MELVSLAKVVSTTPKGKQGRPPGGLSLPHVRFSPLTGDSAIHQYPYALAAPAFPHITVSARRGWKLKGQHSRAKRSPPLVSQGFDAMGTWLRLKKSELQHGLCLPVKHPNKGFLQNRGKHSQMAGKCGGQPTDSLKPGSIFSSPNSHEPHALRLDVRFAKLDLRGEPLGLQPKDRRTSLA